MILDCKGLNCPQPVILTKQAIDKLDTGTLVTIVDNEVAKNNVLKLAKKLQCQTSVIEEDGMYKISISKDSSALNIEEKKHVQKSKSGTVVLCMNDVFGVGDEKLGRVLIKGFFYSLTQLDVAPQSIIFMNNGVKLALVNSAIVESLQELSNKGTEILSCGTCLDFYDVKGQLAIGEITNMYTATETLNEANRIIRV